MNFSPELIGVFIALGTIAINVGLTLGRLRAQDTRLRSLEAARERMGAQLHETVKQMAVLATIVNERAPADDPPVRHRHHQTLTRISGSKGEAVPEATGRESSTEEP